MPAVAVIVLAAVALLLLAMLVAAARKSAAVRHAAARPGGRRRPRVPLPRRGEPPRRGREDLARVQPVRGSGGEGRGVLGDQGEHVLGVLGDEGGADAADLDQGGGPVGRRAAIAARVLLLATV